MKKILIAEDDRIHLKRMLTILRKYKDYFEVIPAADGQEAIEVLKRQPIALLVTDIQMTRVDGLSLLAHVNEHYPELPCLVITAYGTPQVKSRLPNDLLRFFPKPFKLEDLADAIMEILDEWHADGVGSGIFLEKFLYIIEKDQISCVLEVTTAAKTPGVLFFKNGNLVDAECENLSGDSAVLKITLQKIESFSFRTLPVENMPRRIQMSLTDLYKTLPQKVSNL